MFRRRLSLAALSLAMLSLTGCTAAYKMSYLRNSFQYVPDYVQQAKNIRDAKAAFYAEVATQTESPAESPYPEMKACITRMDQALLAQKSAVPAVEPARKEFEAFAQNREDINEKDPDWQRFQAIQGRSGSAINGVQRYTGACAAEGQAFDKLVKDNGIEKVDVAEARRNLNKMLDDVSARIDNQALDVAGGQSRLVGMAVHGLNAMDALKHQQNLQRLEKKNLDLKDERRAAAAELAKFTPDYFGDKRVVWVGPGLEELPGEQEILDLIRDTDDAGKDIHGELQALEPPKQDNKQGGQPGSQGNGPQGH